MHDVDVRTTLTIDDDVLLAAKQRAAVEGISVGQALSALAREGLRRVGSIDTRNGVPLIPNAATAVTVEMVNGLLDEHP